MEVGRTVPLQGLTKCHTHRLDPNTIICYRFMWKPLAESGLAEL